MVAGSGKERATASPLGLILSKASTIAAVVFAAVLLILITEATTSVMKRLIEAYHIKLSYQATLDSKSGLLGRPEEYLNVIFYTPWWLVTPFAGLLLLAGVVMARLINANKFSLHGLYRERLIRAYLGCHARYTPTTLNPASRTAATRFRRESNPENLSTSPDSALFCQP